MHKSVLHEADFVVYVLTTRLDPEIENDQRDVCPTGIAAKQPCSLQETVLSTTCMWL